MSFFVCIHFIRMYTNRSSTIKTFFLIILVMRRFFVSAHTSSENTVRVEYAFWWHFIVWVLLLNNFLCIRISVEKKGTIHGRAAHDMCKQHTDKHIYCLNLVYELFINGTQFRYWFSSAVVRVVQLLFHFTQTSTTSNKWQKIPRHGLRLNYSVR